MRIGHGYDVHRITEGTGMVLGGVHIACPMLLIAHSDGDVLIHAVIDALLGAAGLPDIGAQFPDKDPSYRGIASTVLLEKTAQMLKQARFSISYIDTTIVAQAPKMTPYIAQMRERMAQALEISVSQINVKATTEEHLGFTGSREGIAAHAVCLLQEY